ncbi:MAG: regulator [Actinomycetota bacterium]|nr:regulator [Actinomycetota bacterium]
MRSATRMLADWDYRYGGGRSRLLVAQCLATEALPLARQVSSTSPLGRDYLSAVAALARLAGWTAYDIGSHGAAQRFLTLALNLAREADDRALGGRILAGMSHQANYLGQYHRAVELARAAHAGARGQATPTSMALFYAMEARALAAMGDEGRCTRALNQAEHALAQGNSNDDPEWIRFFDAAELHAELAHCFRDLGRAQLAGEHAQRSIQESDTVYVRSLSFCRAVLATAHLQRRDLEQALQIACTVVDTAAQLRSRRVITYIHDFHRLLLPYGVDKQVAVFDEYVSTHLPELERPPPADRVALA